MKTKLFAAAISLFIYVLFVTGFTLADGTISQVTTDGFHIENAIPDYSVRGVGFIDPAPRPPKFDVVGAGTIDPAPRPPKAMISDYGFIDPAPRPPKAGSDVNGFIDPAPRPPKSN